MATKDKYIEQAFFSILQSSINALLPYGAFFLFVLTVLDYFVMPQYFNKFLLYRVTASSFIMLAFAAFKLKRAPSRTFQDVITITATVIPASMVEAMVLVSGGHQSTYYAGMIVVITFVLGFLVISFRMTLVLDALIYLIYVVPILFFDNITDIRVFINNNIFLLASAMGALGWRYYNEKLLLKNLSLEYELSRDKKQLEVYSLQLKGMVEERTKDLRKSEQWHRSLVDNANDGIIVLDRNGLIVNINDRACEMHGFSRDVLIGTHVRLLEGADTSEELADRIRRLLGGEALVYESRHLKKDGTPLYLEISSKAITIGDDIFIQSFYRDITEKKRMQEHLFQS